MIERDRAYESYAGLAIPFPRAAHLIARRPIDLLVVLGIAAFGPPMHFAASAWAAKVALAAAMPLATMFVVFASNSSADIRSRKTSATISGMSDKPRPHDAHCPASRSDSLSQPASRL
jgi:hypothetical protein